MIKLKPRLSADQRAMVQASFKAEVLAKAQLPVTGPQDLSRRRGRPPLLNREPSVMVSVNLPQSLYEQLNQACVKAGCSRTEGIRLLIKEGLALSEDRR